MNAVYEYLLDKESNLIMQVHDEIIVEVRDGEEYVIEEIRSIMEVNSLNIPLLVDVETHEPSWAHSTAYKTEETQPTQIEENEMAKVGLTVGYTVNLGDFESARVDVTISDIDAAGDVDAQLAEAKPAINKIWPMVKAAADAQAKVVASK
jgi:hypothetical protein